MLKVYAAALAALLSGAALAEPPPLAPATAAELTRADAMALARTRHIEVRTATRALDAARGRRLQADGFAPLNLVYDFEDSVNGNPTQGGNRRYGVEQSFDWPGERSQRKRAGDARIALAQAALKRAELRAVAQAAKAFDEVLLTRANESLFAQSVQRMDEAITLSRVRFQSGQGQYLDVLRTQVARERLANERRRAALAASRAARRLAALLGIAELPAIAGELALDPLPPLDAVLTRWEAESPSRALLAARNREAAAVTAATRAGRLPDFAIGVQRQRFEAAGVGTDAWAGGVRLSVPLPGSDLQRGREAEARAEQNRASDIAAAATIRIDKLLRQRVDEATGLFAQARNFRDAVLPNAEDQLKAAQQEYRVRRIDALNLLDVYNTYLNIQRDYLESLANYRGALSDIDTLGEDLWEITE